MPGTRESEDPEPLPMLAPSPPKEAPRADGRAGAARLRSGPASALLAAVSLVLCGGVSEAVLRMATPHLGRFRMLVVQDAVTGHGLRPGIELEFGGMYERLSAPVVWQVNEQGMRDDHVIAARSERFRVVTYGDSETFGWSVDLEDTYQRQMEALDPRVEVLNLGVPGFNVSNIADHLERTLPRFEPDRAVYLVHKNDFDEPLRISRTVADSHLLLRLRFLYHFTVAKPARVRLRHSEERREVFAREVLRMARFCAEHDVPLLLAFLKWSNRQSLVPLSPDVAVLDVQSALGGYPREDSHLTAPAYRVLAALVCESISGRAGRCVPPAWSPPEEKRVAGRDG